MREVVSLFMNERRAVRLAEACVLSAMLLFGIAPSAIAQNTWKLIKQLDRPIGCAYFFDADHGLIGSGVRWAGGDPGTPCAIYKTTDGGMSWITASVPVTILGAVTSIWMEDTLVGFASIFPSADYSINRTFGGSSLWKTTDGGNTWFDPFHLDHVITSVYAQNGLMIFTKWDMAEYSFWRVMPPDLLGGNLSYDDGATWTPMFRRCNGIAFSDSLNGVVTEMNDDASGNNFWVTMDAGRTWQPSLSNQYESWSIYAVPGQRIYFCANESQPGSLPYKTINWSTDGGFTWSARASFPVMHFTGTIAGAANTLYFQTDDAYYGDVYQTGMYRSDDLGINWHWVGGPANSRDTRFAVTGCQGQVVYAFDELGEVWKTTDGGDGTLGAKIGLSSDTIFWLPNPCGDTLNFNAFCSNCIPISIDSASVLSGTELLPLPDSGRLGELPAVLQQNDSAQISVLYSPTKGGESFSVVRVFAHSGESFLTRDLTIRIENSSSNTLVLSPDSSSMNVSSCGSAMDSVLLFNSGCSGLSIDSVSIPSSELTIVNSLPALVSDSLPCSLRFLYQPDSAENQTVRAHIYAHEGQRLYDTVITLQTQSTQAPPTFALDSTTLIFETRFCQPRSATLGLSAISCDSVTIDSAISSNSGFVLSGVPSTMMARSRDSLMVSYAPDSAGITNGEIHIFAHDGLRRFDTTISIVGTNYEIPQAVTLSTTGLTLATSACQPKLDTLFLTDQGCDSLYLDSVTMGDDSEISVSFDSVLLPMSSNDTLPLRIVYNPQDGISKVSTLRLLLHTSSRRIDTTIALTISNKIPAEPLALSSDSLYLFTKYCQPVSMPLQISNFGCQAMTIDSTVILGDTLGEFSIPSSNLGIATNQTTTTDVTFTPAIAGSRSVKIMVYLHAGSKAIDTVISLAGKNLTAPVPYIPPLSSLAAGTILQIPIMLEPTLDTFSICSYAFHLSFNTDLLTPLGLEFANTRSSDTLSYTFTPEPGGCSGRVFLRDTISDTGQLLLPLVYVRAKVSLTLDTVTNVTLDSFVTDREPALELCSIPQQPFHLAMVCGDPLLLQLLNAETLSFNFISVAPNPAASGNWDVNYDVRGTSPMLKIDVYDAAGNPVYHSSALASESGEHTIRIPIPQGSGDYFIVLSNGREQTARSASVIR